MTIWIAVVVAGLGSYLLLVLGVVTVLRPGSGLAVMPVVAALVAATVCALKRRTMLTTVVIGAATYVAALVLMSPGLLGR